MKGRFLATIMAVAILASTVITTAFADGDPTLTVLSETANPGDTVNVTVSLQNNPGIVSLRVKIGYDSSVLTMTGLTDAGVLGTEVHQSYLEEGVAHYNLSANPYILYWDNGAALENFIVNGTIATFTFAVSENAAVGDYPITATILDCFNYDLDDVDFTVVNGKVTVEAGNPAQVLIGDVNDDGKVNAFDRTTLARHIAKWDGYGEADINYAAADVNDDGKVNAFDRTTLARYIAKWDGYETLPKK